MTRRTVVVSVASMLALTVNGTAAAEPVSLEQAVSAAMIAAKGDDAAAAYGQSARAALEPRVEPKRSAADGDWVFGGSVFLIPGDVEATPVTALFFAERAADGSWQVALEGSQEFAQLAREAPDALFVDDGERAVLASSPREHDGTGLALPWRKGEGGWMHSGVHGIRSPSGIVRNALDFFDKGDDGVVRASAGGYLYRFCTTVNPYIQVRHPNGWTTGYYHQIELTDVPDGSWIDAYDVIGVIGEELPCEGGHANRPHVHWALLDHSGQPVPLDGRTVGGWTWHEEPGVNYAGYGERRGRKLYGEECCLTNYGAYPR